MKFKFSKYILHKLIRQVISDVLVLKEGKLTLNKDDIVVSGTLSLGIYESFETVVFRASLKKGMTVVDIGANVGYYTVIAASSIGAGGRVIAFEPEPVNFGFLCKNIKNNGFTNTEMIQNAVTDHGGWTKLFLSADNNLGDHRLFDGINGRRNYIDVKTVRLDDFMRESKIEKIDVVKMDIQGAEGLAVDGMLNSLPRSYSQWLFTEFWPLGLSQTGKSPLEFLRTLVGLNFSLFEISESKRKLLPVEDFSLLINNNKGKKYTNLYCVKTECRKIESREGNIASFVYG